MPELANIDPRSAALLVLDYQVDALTRFMTAAQSVTHPFARGFDRRGPRPLHESLEPDEVAQRCRG